jgi:hypothetical protein
MSTIQKIKNQREETTQSKDVSSKSNVKKNNWSGFGSSLAGNFLNLFIMVILGGNLIFAIRNMGLERYLPTNTQQKPYNVQNIQSLFKSFPYKKISNPQSLEQKMQNWLANTIQGSWVFNRGMFQEVFNGMNELTNVQFPSMENTERRMKMERWAKVAIESIFFVFSPILLLLLAFLAGTFGFFSTILNGYKSANGFIHKLFGLTGGYFLAFALSTLQFFWAISLIVFKPFTINLEHVFKTVKDFKGLIMFLSILFILSSAMSNLSQGINIGLVIGLIVLFGGTILAKLF